MRYKDLLRKCPHHGIDKFCQISIFYGGLTPTTKQMVETMCSGSFLVLGPNEAEAHFEYMYETSRGWDVDNPYDRTLPDVAQSKAQALYQVAKDTDPLVQLTRKVEALESNRTRE